MRWEGEGYRTARLEALLADPPTAEVARSLVARFNVDVARLQAIEERIRSIDPNAAELNRTGVLRDPDSVEAAERLAARVAERMSLVAMPDGAQPDGTHAQPRAVTVGPRANGPGPAHHEVRAPMPDAALGAGRRIQRLPRGPEIVDSWFLAQDKVLWRWPYVDDWIVAHPPRTNGNQG
jgi:hypothetical protein